MFCSPFDNNLAPILWTSNLYACLILRIQLWATKIDFFLIKFDVQKKWIICINFVAGVTNFCGYINISSFF